MSNRDFIYMKDSFDKQSYSIWTNVHDVKVAYNIEETAKYYSLHSEFIYFKKKPKNKLFFDTTKRTFLNLKVEHTGFANSIPDELPFAISSMLVNQYPHKDSFLPSFWQMANKKTIPTNELYQNYYFMSMGGATIDNKSRDTYNNLSKAYSSKLGFNDYYVYKNKSSYLKERKSI